MQGLPQEQYAQTLANTRIAICPPGFASHETIRHWEAMRLGCIIITAPLPDNRFYRNSPMIVLDHWADLRPTIDRLLANTEEMMRLHLATSDWWNNRCGEQALAHHVAGVLAN